MKKTLALMLSVAMAFGITACGGKEEKAPQTEQKPSAEQTDVNSGAIPEDGAITGEIERKSDFLELKTASVKECYSAHGKELATVEYPVVELGDKARAEYPELAKAVDALNEEEKTAAMNAHNENIKLSEEYYDADSDREWVYEYATTVGVKRADKSVLTLQYSNSTYSGGAHGYYGFYGRSFDVKTGKRLELTDVVKDISALPDLIREQLELYWGDAAYIFPEAVDDIVTEWENMPWSLDYNGLTLYYNPYHLASYSSGAQFVTIPCKDNPELFNEEYVNHPSEYAFQVKKGTVVSEDVTGDGIIDKFSVSGYMNYEFGYMDKLFIEINDMSTEYKLYAYTIDPVLLRTDDGCYLYVECEYENGNNHIICYKLGDNIQEIDEYSGGAVCTYEKKDGTELYFRSVTTDPNAFYLSKRVGAFGGLWGDAVYFVDDSGLPDTTDGLYMFGKGDYFHELTLLRDLEVEEFDMKTNSVVGKKTLKTGDTVRCYATDDVNEEYLLLDDGTVVRVMLDDETEFLRTIGGEPVTEIFDNIVFAG